MNKVAIVGTGETKFSKNDEDVEQLLLESANNCINTIKNCELRDIEAVSYTHLTLPTIYSV